MFCVTFLRDGDATMETMEKDNENNRIIVENNRTVMKGSEREGHLYRGGARVW